MTRVVTLPARSVTAMPTLARSLCGTGSVAVHEFNPFDEQGAMRYFSQRSFTETNGCGCQIASSVVIFSVTTSPLTAVVIFNCGGVWSVVPRQRCIASTAVQ